MNIGTGQTIYEQIISLDCDNNPVTGATFDTAMYQNGDIYTGITVSSSNRCVKRCVHGIVVSIYNWRLSNVC